ncbi:LOW QUALITY PROTEIN: permease of the major facilitator superfamily [Vibrio sp. JCM 19052]|nr:LOW QUALITY PROTEIN: permease of the major facilitator superfamily [Vibrio sp. JCM 19052]
MRHAATVRARPYGHFSLPLVLMVLFSAVWTTVQATFILEYLQFHPTLMFAAVGIMMLFKCIAMMNQKPYLFGYMGLLVGSIVLNFASYDFMDIEEFNVNLWVISFSNIFVCALAYWLFPEPESKILQTEMTTPVKSDIDYISQVAMVGWWRWRRFWCSIGDLYDSLSAQASILIILTPMTLAGSMAMAKIRIIGTALGCIAGMAVQLILGSWFGHGLLFWLAFTIAMGPFCLWLTKGQVKAAIAFSAMSALSVPLTRSLVPEQKDAFFSILYRFSSIFVAVLLTAMVMWVVHHWIRVMSLKHPEMKNVEM